MARRHRNLFREYLDVDARTRADAGLAPLTHAQWAEKFNKGRPTIGGRRVREVAESSVSRAVSGTVGVARRIGMDRAWILSACGIDYHAYLEAWGDGPAGTDEERKHRRARRIHGRREKSDRAHGGR